MKMAHHLDPSFPGHRVLPDTPTPGGPCAKRKVVGLLPLLLLATGCGNQMLRQPSFSPLDTPRAAAPTDSVPVSVGKTPFDAKPVASAANGDAIAEPVIQSLAAFPSKEPDLPPPNLSDNARNEPAPASVDELQSPLPNDPRIVQAGHVLFLNRCVQCHNPGGYGYGTVGQYLVPHPPDLASPLVQHISNGAVFWHITMGQGKMPGFRHWTTPSERWSLVAYVRTLKGAKFDPLRDDASAWTATSTAPYPVYGVSGFEQGKSAYPFKVINPEGGEPTSRPRVTNRGFGQPPPGAPADQP
jgi:mono/diheme cytochrome c family protein